jgi:peptidylprolyl isomerase
VYNKIILLVCVLVFATIGTVAWIHFAPSRTPVGTEPIVDAKDILGAFGDQSNMTDATTSNQSFMHAILHTNKGDITIEFLPQQAPNTVANFEKLASTGFYDETKFHRVIKGFMIQGGDPLSKDDSQEAKWGTGGPGYSFKDELGPDNHNVSGTIAMANSGPDTNGSQFFINAVDNTYLDDKHTVFGKVIGGMDVVEAIDNTPTDSSDRPVDPVIIQSITLE